METLDVTKIEPRLKHSTICDKFDALISGDWFIIKNDHDPIPLYYQMLAERGNVFDWEYLSKGPEIYEVKITKLKKEETPTTIGTLVAKDFRKAEVFKKFGIDFCCGGNKTVKEVCEKKGINQAEVEKQLTLLDLKPKNNENDFEKWGLDFLCDFIQNTHHVYVREALPLLDELSIKVANVHGAENTNLLKIANKFKLISNELKSHMQEEELVLFPYIKELAKASKTSLLLNKSTTEPIRITIQNMESEHEIVGDSLKEIRILSNQYRVPEDACNSYRVLFSKLEEFEEDLHHHVHLENNLLFPKAIDLENKLFTK